MRSLFILLAMSVVGSAVPAMAYDNRYCIMGCNYGVRGDCSFSTYQQCLASASGRDAWCAENTGFNAKAEMPANGIRQSRRRL